VRLEAITAEVVTQLAKYEVTSTSWPWGEAKMLQSLSSEHHCYALVEDKAIGYCVLLLIDEVLEILNLVIFSEFQGRGYGRLLVDKIKAVARDLGASMLWLEVRADNHRARKVYLSAEFSETGIRKNYYPNLTGSHTKSPQDAVLMQCALEISS
jgi:ribosomal-protein-alanine N-acetyltransferase